MNLTIDTSPNRLNILSQFWFDKGIENSSDNCPKFNSTDLTDSDGDGVGDVCDNCPRISNTDQVTIKRIPTFILLVSYRLVSLFL